MTSALYEAIAAGNVERAARVLDEQPELKRRLNEPIEGGSFGATALLVAAGTCNRAMLDLLLRAGADINQKSHWWAGPFGVMDEAWREPWMPAFLMDRGATLEIHHAVRLGMADDVRRMIDADSSAVHARGGDGQLPLHLAQSVEMAALLLDRGADVNARDVDHESTAAQYMIRDRTNVARYLVDRGSDCDILMASALGDGDGVQRLLDADPEAIRTCVSAEYFPMRNPKAGGTIYIWTLGWFRTPHTVARAFGHEDLRRILMDRTPMPLKLAAAIVGGDDALVPGLMKTFSPAQLSAADRRQIITAAATENVQAVRGLLAAGWPADIHDSKRVTPLHWAAFHGRADMARLLLEHAARADVRDDEFRALPLGWAVFGSVHGWHPDRGDYGGVVDALFDAGSEVPPSEPDGSEAVRAAWRRRRA